MAAWRYKISLLVLKKYFMSERSERVKYFSTLEEKFRISARPFDILYIKKAHSNPPRPARLWLIEFLVICNNTKENFLWEPEKINVNFHKNTSYT